MSIKELAVTICRLTGSRSELRHGPARAGDVKHSLASIEKLLNAGFQPAGDLSAGLEQTIRFFQQRISA
jgi:UDP-glucose 4-epimerase